MSHKHNHGASSTQSNRVTAQAFNSRQWGQQPDWFHSKKVLVQSMTYSLALQGMAMLQAQEIAYVACAFSPFSPAAMHGKHLHGHARQQRCKRCQYEHGYSMAIYLCPFVQLVLGFML